MSPSSFRTRRRSRAVVGITAALGLLGAGFALPAGAAPSEVPADSGATALPSNLKLLQVRTSLLAEHRWYRQIQDGYPVVGGLYAVHETTVGAEDGQVRTWDGRVAVGAVQSTDATISSAAAIDAAVAHTGGTVMTFVAPSLWVLPGAPAKLVWGVNTFTSDEAAGGQSHITYVDARTGAVVQSAVESQRDTEAKTVTGKARVFDPNPIAKMQDQDLSDENDSNGAVPDKAYSERKLKNLDKSHTLVGKWAKVVNDDLASSPNNKYYFKRADEEFEQVSAYYALDTEQQYYRKLGFKNINAEPQKIETNTFDGDNSFYSPGQDLITMGAGGVDDAEDPEVTWHEAGHATQDDQVPNFGQGNEAGSIGEGFGDYIAVTLSQQFAKDTRLTPWTCVMDWDATSYTEAPHCLRTTDTDKMYPEDMQGEVHADGEIWSAALWDINVAIGRDKATTAILEGQFEYAPNTTFPAAANKTVTAAKALYGQTIANKVKKAFEDRGIL